MEQRTGGGSVGRTNGNMTARELTSAAQDQLEQLRMQAGEINERIVGFIRERPGTAILIAVGAGFLIGRMLRS